MRNLSTRLLFIAITLGCYPAFAGNYWEKVNPADAPKNLQLLHPANFLVYTMDEAALKLQLWNLSTDPSEAMIITLPLPNGSYRDFKVWQTPMLPADLSATYPDIKTFTAEAVDNKFVTAKLDFTTYGFHAMVYDGENTAFIDPYDNFHDGFYMAHYKKDEVRVYTERMKCEVRAYNENSPAGEPMETDMTTLPKLVAKTINGAQLRTYRLALGCSHQYAQAVTGSSTPTVSAVLAKLTTTMNRVNGVYERELSIHMNFVSGETSLIFTTATGDPYGADNSSAGNLLTDNQTECDAVIGPANYDLGHVFSTGAGGLSLLGVVCQNGLKAQSATGSAVPYGDGFDIDYVAHEMGHEFGADHSFNDNSQGSCGGNAVSSQAYEPGSGSTIMCYAGICSPDDIQLHSDAYFHAASLQQIYSYVIAGSGGACPAITSSGNTPIDPAPYNAVYSIPYLTPFELTQPTVADPEADSIVLYCWEEWDLGDFGQTFTNTHNSGPLFRSYPPDKSNTRVFPKITMVLTGTLSNAGLEGNQGEKVPDVARTLKFKCIHRDIKNNKGCYTIPDDMVTLTAVPTGTGAGFKVTSQGTGVTYLGGSTQTVTWTVLNTNVAPINAGNVNIYMSTNGGLNWQYLVGTYANTGSASVILPNPSTTTSTVRFKVKGANNVFFNVNSSDFTVNYNSAVPVTPSNIDSPMAVGIAINIFPVPANDMIHVITDSFYQGAIYNVLGQRVWEGTISGPTDINTSIWARGSYYMIVIDNRGNKTVKRLLIN